MQEVCLPQAVQSCEEAATSSHGDHDEHGPCTDSSCELEHDRHNHHHGHRHDSGVTSVAIEKEGALDPQAINTWLGQLLQDKGPDLYRSKGILYFAGEEHRLVRSPVWHELLASLT